MKLVDLGEPTSLLCHVYLGYAIIANGNRTKVLLMNTEKCSNHESLPEQLKSYVAGRNVTRTRSLGLTTWEDMRRDALRGIAKWQNKKLEQLYEVSTPCMDDHHFKKEELDMVGEEPKVCSQIVLWCLYLVRIGRPDILWSVDKLARAVTKWTRACDRRSALLISYIKHTSDYRQCCPVGHTAQHCRKTLFQNSDFAGDL